VSIGVAKTKRKVPESCRLCWWSIREGRTNEKIGQRTAQLRDYLCWKGIVARRKNQHSFAILTVSSKERG